MYVVVGGAFASKTFFGLGCFTWAREGWREYQNRLKREDIEDN
jgi:hypothetical protein